MKDGRGEKHMNQTCQSLLCQPLITMEICMGIEGGGGWGVTYGLCEQYDRAVLSCYSNWLKHLHWKREQYKIIYQMMGEYSKCFQIFSALLDGASCLQCINLCSISSYHAWLANVIISPCFVNKGNHFHRNFVRKFEWQCFNEHSGLLWLLLKVWDVCQTGVDVKG